MFSNSLESTQEVSSDFESLLWTLGWPIDLASHRGFKGAYSSRDLPVTPYFANLSIEIIFFSPCLLQKGKSKKSPVLKQTKLSDHPSPQFSASASDLSKQKHIPTPIELSFPRSRTLESLLSGSSNVSKYQDEMKTPVDLLTQEDVVSIIWIENISHTEMALETLPQHIQIFIFVNPVCNGSGLCYIRIIGRSSVPPLCLVFICIHDSVQDLSKIR